MLYLVIAVEGVSEKNLIEEYVYSLLGQTPGGYRRIEIVPFSVGGNHGYTKLVKTANSFVKTYRNDPWHCIEPDDVIEKWLVFDYDDIEEKDITLEELKKQAAESGFTCVVSKPNFEFFILSILGGYEYAVKINPDNYIGEINSLINKLNEKDVLEKEWFTDAMKIIPYSKRTYQSGKCFAGILQQHPELFEKILEENDSVKGERYSEMPNLLKRILWLINNNDY